MQQGSKNQFPGGSKTRVTKAGDNFRKGNWTKEDEKVIEEWRKAHRAVLNTFQASLRSWDKKAKEKDIKDIVIAQRHKRKSTIINKLHRFPEMSLARMDDVAGCRLIFANIDELNTFRKLFHTARFKHERCNKDNPDKYDYIKKPKKTGYRGIHDVYRYDVNSENGKRLKGLLVEIQYRTKIQHTWATAVEVIGLLTKNKPKFQEGDKDYQDAMALASEILARSEENSKSCFPEKTDTDLVNDFLKIDEKIDLIGVLNNVNKDTHELSKTKYNIIILIFSEDGKLETQKFRSAAKALNQLFLLEKNRPKSDIVLVKADSSADVRIAFQNYFSDTQDFVELVTEGCKRLAPQLAPKIKEKLIRRNSGQNGKKGV